MDLEAIKAEMAIAESKKCTHMAIKVHDCFKLLSEVERQRKRIEELESRCEYIRSAYCDSLDVAKEFADKALIHQEGAECRCGSGIPHPAHDVRFLDRYRGKARGD